MAGEVTDNFLAVARKFPRPRLAVFSAEKTWLRLSPPSQLAVAPSPQ